jgi:hypothetical protein
MEAREANQPPATVRMCPLVSSDAADAGYITVP